MTKGFCLISMVKSKVVVGDMGMYYTFANVSSSIFHLTQNKSQASQISNYF